MVSFKYRLQYIISALTCSFFLAYAPAYADSPEEQPDKSTAPESLEATKSATIDLTDINTGGAGDLLVAPTRLVLDSHKKTAEVMLNNKGSKEATYRISFAHIKMDDNGHYTELDEKAAQDPSLKFADTMLRYSPHQVTLKPGETQVVKVMMRASENQAEGEYCSHLLFRAVPDASAGENIEGDKPEAGKISVHLIPIYGVSIPLIVRQGNLSAQAKINNVHISGQNLLLTLSRLGKQSVYGDVIITEAGSDKVVGQLRSIAVLTTNDRRNLSIPLSAQAEGTLTVEYRERIEDGGKLLDKTSVKM